MCDGVGDVMFPFNQISDEFFMGRKVKIEWENRRGWGKGERWEV